MTPTDLATALRQLPLTQREFANLLGHDKQTVSNWCRGKRPIPEYVDFIISTLREKADREAFINLVLRRA